MIWPIIYGFFTFLSFVILILHFIALVRCFIIIFYGFRILRFLGFGFGFDFDFDFEFQAHIVAESYSLTRFGLH